MPTAGRLPLDLAGRTFGFLLVIARVPLPITSNDRKPLWLCYCHECSEFACLSTNRLVHCHQMTCGCVKYWRTDIVRYLSRHRGPRYTSLIKSRAAKLRWAHKRRGKARGDGKLRIGARRSGVDGKPRAPARVLPQGRRGESVGAAAGDD